jgi:UDP-N-acetylmuramate dehydrogenase
MQIKDRLIDIVGEGAVQSDAPMAGYTSFRAGGAADLLVTVEATDDLREVLAILAENEYPFMVLGNGSNVLVRDGGYHGVIVKLGDSFNYVRTDGTRLVCGASTLMAVTAKAALGASLTGFEFASGIPGSIGGAAFMNAGAYGGEMVNIIQSVHVVSRDGSKEYDLTAEEMEMGYRHSILHETGDVATEVILQLKPGNPDEIKETMVELTAKRNEKQPVNYPSAGSFFKRPEGYFAGKLIQDAGLKGLTVGGAQVSELHSGFVINKGGATATDILKLMEIVQAKVYDDFKVKLEPEVRIIGEDR